ncbi:low temperature requirement protein LtrA [Micromonospora pisi]|uniref:Low temperature requirement protein LtrA n=1 Tax=Micromonospora pisi TaxID=589240 RepID=A0A495JDF7_9ACTN|nr:low temperature requirement protein A [Micromonospora pisi]RKR86394.1 low temperature requirement protein LtrA [Micromonospora pisi]
MTTDRYAGLIRDPNRPQRATAVELFYDLVYVFMLARLAEALIHDLHPLGAYETLILLLATWWVWSYTNLATDTLDSSRPAVQLLVIAIMFGSLVMSTAVPDAFEGRGLLFASAYVGIHLGRSLVLAVILRRHRLRNRPLRGIFWFGMSGAIWIAGAFSSDGVRVLLWTLALALDYLGPMLRWPTPWIGRSPAWEWNLAGEHLAERYRQFIIIALGETIVITARTFRSSDYGSQRVFAFVTAFATTVLLWWIYFYRTREKLGNAITGSADPGRETKWAGYAHLVMVAGVVLTTVGDELIIKHPYGPMQESWVAVIIGGPVLFLLGRTLLGHEVFVHVARPWVIGTCVLVAMAPGMLFLPPVAVSATVVAVLFAIVLADALSTRERRG